MLAKDRTNLKIEEIRMHKHHEIHRVGNAANLLI